MSLFKRWKAKEDLKLSESWSVSQGNLDGRPIIIRLNRGVQEAHGHPELQHQIGVAIPLKAPDENGFPGPEESAKLAEIEDLLVERLEPDRMCLHVATISTGGMREFVFYSSDPETSRREIEMLSKTITSHELQHIVQADPDWRVYQRLAS